MKVFLSHASESKPLVRRIAEQLPRHVDVWFDQDELEAGNRFPEVIERTIRLESDFCAVFVDAWALDSEWVRREVRWALEREAALQRPFVIPVLIDEVEPRLPELGFDPSQRLYLDARDRSDAGTVQSGQRLAAELFKLASRLIESLRSVDRRALIDAFAADLTQFQQAAYMFVAALENRIAVIASEAPVTKLVLEAVNAYNDAANGFVARLPQHRDRLTAAWRDRRALCNDIRELVVLIDPGVYRGALFALNDVLEAVHTVSTPGQEADAATLAGHDARREALLAEAKRALERLSAKAGDVLGDLEAELQA